MIEWTEKLKEAYSALVSVFLEKIQVIKKLNPAYKQPGDGSNGVCDCIGLIIGAVKRMGLKWTGIHGSNYAARYQTVGLAKINSVDDLELGDVVYKACEKGSGRWDLPSRYWQGNKYYNGDLKDYYHAGAVTSVNPLNITHMTSPHMKVDTRLDHNKNSVWNYHGKVKPIVEAAEKGKIPDQTKPDIPEEQIPNDGSRAIVVSENGGPVMMREYPSKDCRTWVKLPVGTEVTIVEPGETWAKIDYGKKKGWYMMAEFLDIVGDGKGKY